MGDVNPIDFGRLVQSVEQLKAEMSELHTEVKQLRSLADRGKGAFWFAGLLWASLGVTITGAWHWIRGPH